MINTEEGFYRKGDLVRVSRLQLYGGVERYFAIVGVAAGCSDGLIWVRPVSEPGRGTWVKLSWLELVQRGEQ